MHPTWPLRIKVGYKQQQKEQNAWQSWKLNNSMLIKRMGQQRNQKKIKNWMKINPTHATYGIQ